MLILHRWRFSVAVTRWSRSTQLRYIENVWFSMGDCLRVDKLSHYVTSHVISFFTLSFIGLTYLNVSSINSVWWFTGVSMDALPSTWRRTVFLSLQYCRQTASAFCCSSSVGGTVSPRLSTYGRRAFAIAGPTTWNSLPTPSSCGERHRCIWTIT